MSQDNPEFLAFCQKYQLTDPARIAKLYEIEELLMYLPSEPSLEEQTALQKLIGVEGVSGYMDYIKSGNTFELIMQWREATGNF